MSLQKTLINYLFLFSIFILLSPFIISCNMVSTEELQQAVQPLNEGNNSQAILNLEALKKKHPDNPQILYYLGLAYLRGKKIKEAYSNIDHALKIKPNFKKVVGDIPLANFLSGNSQSINDPFFKTAILELKKIVNLQKGTEKADEVLFHIGLTYLTKKAFKEAIQEFNKVIENPPVSNFDGDAGIFMGDIYIEHLDDHEKALLSYKKVLSLFPDSELSAKSFYHAGIQFEKKMLLYKKRHISFVNFANYWEGVDTLKVDRDLAITKGKENLKIAETFRDEAIANFASIESKHKNSSYYNSSIDKISKIKSELENIKYSAKKYTKE